MVKDPDEKRGLRNAIPADLFQAMAPYFSTTDLFQKIGILWRSKAIAGGSAILVEDWAQEYADAFRFAVLQYKRRKIKDFDAYLFAAWRETTYWIRRKVAIAAGDNSMFYNWLRE